MICVLCKKREATNPRLQLCRDCEVKIQAKTNVIRQKLEGSDYFAVMSAEINMQLGDYKPTRPQQETIFDPTIYEPKALNWLLIIILAVPLGFASFISLAMQNMLVFAFSSCLLFIGWAIVGWVDAAGLYSHHNIDSGVGLSLTVGAVGQSLASLGWLAGLSGAINGTSSGLEWILFIGGAFLAAVYGISGSSMRANRLSRWTVQAKLYPAYGEMGVTWRDNGNGTSTGIDQNGNELTAYDVGPGFPG